MEYSRSIGFVQSSIRTRARMMFFPENLTKNLRVTVIFQHALVYKKNEWIVESVKFNTIKFLVNITYNVCMQNS